MTIGIPGTGLGALFYVVLVLVMPFREVLLTLRWRSSGARWREVGFQLLVAASIVGVLASEAWLLERVFAAAPPGRDAPERDLFLRTGQAAAIACFLALAVLLAGVTALSHGGGSGGSAGQATNSAEAARPAAPRPVPRPPARHRLPTYRRWTIERR